MASSHGQLLISIHAVYTDVNTKYKPIKNQFCRNYNTLIYLVFSIQAIPVRAASTPGARQQGFDDPVGKIELGSHRAVCAAAADERPCRVLGSPLPLV
jgi:hypothetical protein